MHTVSLCLLSCSLVVLNTVPAAAQRRATAKACIPQVSRFNPGQSARLRHTSSSFAQPTAAAALSNSLSPLKAKPIPAAAVSNSSTMPGSTSGSDPTEILSYGSHGFEVPPEETKPQAVVQPQQPQAVVLRSGVQHSAVTKP
jgi:hypothetical protein